MSICPVCNSVFSESCPNCGFRLATSTHRRCLVCGKRLIRYSAAYCVITKKLMHIFKCESHSTCLAYFYV